MAAFGLLSESNRHGIQSPLEDQHVQESELIAEEAQGPVPCQQSLRNESVVWEMKDGL